MQGSHQYFILHLIISVSFWARVFHWEPWYPFLPLTDGKHQIQTKSDKMKFHFAHMAECLMLLYGRMNILLFGR